MQRQCTDTTGILGSITSSALILHCFLHIPKHPIYPRHSHPKEGQHDSIQLPHHNKAARAAFSTFSHECFWLNSGKCLYDVYVYASCLCATSRRMNRLSPQQNSTTLGVIILLAGDTLFGRRRKTTTWNYSEKRSILQLWSWLLHVLVLVVKTEGEFHCKTWRNIGAHQMAASLVQTSSERNNKTAREVLFVTLILSWPIANLTDQKYTYDIFYSANVCSVKLESRTE